MDVDACGGNQGETRGGRDAARAGQRASQAKCNQAESCQAESNQTGRRQIGDYVNHGKTGCRFQATHRKSRRHSGRCGDAGKTCRGETGRSQSSTCQTNSCEAQGNENPGSESQAGGG